VWPSSGSTTVYQACIYHALKPVHNGYSDIDQTHTYHPFICILSVFRRPNLMIKFNTRACAGSACIRCTIEEQIFLSTWHYSTSAPATLAKIRCHVAFGRGRYHPGDPEGIAASYHHVAQAAMAVITRDASLHTFCTCDHFAPFTHPAMLARSVKEVLLAQAASPLQSRL
jgi:hypothetical protein